MRLADATLAGGAAGPTNVWLWGQGRRATLPTLRDRFGITGAVISAVDLVRGMGRSMGMDVIEVEGATGDIDTNFAGKGEAAAAAIDKYDLVFCHIEAPDEASHRGEADSKQAAIEAVDREVLARVHGKAKERGDTRLLVLPDHLTPLSIRTHAHGKVPFVLWGPGLEPRPAPAFTEREAESTESHVERGWEILSRALGSD
jgi:2,3-bisphosphoglycerate-independent phosphoglycerate mutase